MRGSRTELPGNLSGEWLFKGARVLFENLEDGARIDDFLAWFPGVGRRQVEDVLRNASSRPTRICVIGKTSLTDGWL